VALDTSNSKSKGREGRIAGHVRLAREIGQRPGKLIEIAREWFVRLWRTKGGGYYGFGYVITFIVLEVATLAIDIESSDGVMSFVTAQALQYVIRVSLESLVNAFIALLWPIYLLQRTGAWGLVVLAGGYFVFRFLLRPLLVRWFPE